MAGYVFVSNTTKPNKEKYMSRELVTLTNFSRPSLKAALSMGYDVFYGAQRGNPEELTCELPVKLYDAHTYRSITAFKDNKIAYDNLNKLIRENDIEVIHCNTPVGGMIGRLCGKKNKVKKVIYTVHGFHFYKGAPLFNRTILKWAEKLMAHWTDAIITINTEDYAVAQTLKLRPGGKVYYMHGVGIDTAAFAPDLHDGTAIRGELGLSPEDMLMVSAGELNHNKNNRIILEALAKAACPHVHYALCGVGPLMEELKALAVELGIGDRVHFLGFRRDIKDIYAGADVFAMPSYREGLSRSMMEAMASGLPCIASRIRGNTDLVVEGAGGYLSAPTDADGFAKAIKTLADDPALRQQMREHNLEYVKNFDTAVAEQEIKKIYEEVLG